jgi:hypothetical protein
VRGKVTTSLIVRPTTDLNMADIVEDVNTKDVNPDDVTKEALDPKDTQDALDSLEKEAKEFDKVRQLHRQAAC